MTPDPNLIEDLRLLEPIGFWWLWVILGGGLLVALVMFLRRVWRRHRGRRPEGVGPGRPPHEAALEALEQLAGMLDRTESRRYGIESTRIVRSYIETRFGIRAPVQATEEFLVAASESEALAVDHRELLRDYLGCCDLLKFARNRADGGELRELHDSAVRFVVESAGEEAVRRS